MIIHRKPSETALMQVDLENGLEFEKQ